MYPFTFLVPFSPARDEPPGCSQVSGSISIELVADWRYFSRDTNYMHGTLILVVRNVELE